MTRWEHFLRELRRVRWALAGALLGAVALSTLADTSKLALIFYKISLLTIAWILWHLLRTETFDYIEFNTLLKQGGLRPIAAAIVIGLTCIAVILGMMLGL